MLHGGSLHPCSGLSRVLSDSLSASFTRTIRVARVLAGPRSPYSRKARTPRGSRRQARFGPGTRPQTQSRPQRRASSCSQVDDCCNHAPPHTTRTSRGLRCDSLTVNVGGPSVNVWNWHAGVPCVSAPPSRLGRAVTSRERTHIICRAAKRFSQSATTRRASSPLLHQTTRGRHGNVKDRCGVDATPRWLEHPRPSYVRYANPTTPAASCQGGVSCRTQGEKTTLPRHRDPAFRDRQEFGAQPRSTPEPSRRRQRAGRSNEPPPRL